jgi:hypothetical protein
LVLILAVLRVASKVDEWVETWATIITHGYKGVISTETILTLVGFVVGCELGV